MDTCDRVAWMSGRSMADYRASQVKVARAHTAIETAPLLLHRYCDEGMLMAERGEIAPLPHKATELHAKATKLAAEAVDLLFQLSDGVGLYDRNPISRAMCDLNCMGGLITRNWNVKASNRRLVVLALPCADPAL